MTLEEIIDLGVKEYKDEQKQADSKSWLDGFVHGFIVATKRIVDLLREAGND